MSLERSRTYIGPAELDDTTALVIGCGSMGSAVALTWGRMGVGTFILVDNGAVEEVNIGPQFFSAAQIGMSKTQALEKLLKIFSPSSSAVPWKDELLAPGRDGFPWHVPPECVRYVDGTDLDVDVPDHHITLLAVDTMAARKAYLQLNYVSYSQVLIDVRAGLQEIWIEVMPGSEAKAYGEQLPTDEETVEAPCTEKTIAYTPMLVAGWCGRILAAHLRGEPMPKEIHSDLKVFNHWCVWPDGRVE